MGQLPHAFSESISTTTRPNCLKLSQSTLHICPQNVSKFQSDPSRIDEVDFACPMAWGMGQLPHAFSESISTTTWPNVPKLSQCDPHICPQVLLEFEVNRSRTAEVHFRCPISWGMGHLPHAFSESISTTTWPNVPKLSQCDPHICPQVLLEFEVNRSRTAEVHFRCPISWGMGQLPHAFMESISRTTWPNALQLSGELLRACPQHVFEFESDRIRIEEVDFRA
jgi:uncharacterized protein YeaC (DUF1315 family)